MSANDNIMQKIIWLSKTDTDLISAYEQLGSRKFIKVAKEAMREMVRPGYKSKFLAEIRHDLSVCYRVKDNNPKTIHITFSNKDDSDIHILLINVKDRMAGKFLKSVLRFGLGARFIIGSNLESDKDLCEDYKDNGLFFVANIPKIPIITQVVEEKVKEEPKPIPMSTPVKYEPELPPMPTFEDNGGNNTDDDDDILSMLDNM